MARRYLHDSGLMVGALLVMLVMLVCCSRSHAQVVRLAELEASALSGRPELAAAKARLSADAARIDQARSAYRPVLSGKANGGISPGQQLIELQDAAGTSFLVAASRPLGESGAFEPQARYGVSIGMRGNLYDFGRTRAGVEAARSARRATEAQAREAGWAIVLEVRAAYLRWAGAQALLAIARDHATAAELRLERVTALTEQGALPSLERSRAQQQSVAARLDVERAAEELEAARLDLGIACAREIPGDAEPDPELLEGSAGRPSEGDFADARAGLEALERAAAAASAHARAESRARAPVLGYELDTGINGQMAHVFPGYRAGLSLTAPLFDGGTASASAAESHARARELSAQAEIEGRRLQHISRRIESARSHAERRLVLARDALRLARATLEQLEQAEPELRALEARRDVEFTVLQARSELVRAQVDMARVRLGLVSL